jgi:hypothetical protein
MFRPLTKIVWLLVLAIVGSSCQGTFADEPQPKRSAAPKRLILAHYMPWFTADPEKQSWGWHWTMNHFDPRVTQGDRRQIASKYYPLIGPYDSADPATLQYHLLLMKLSGIDGVIVDWYGREEFRDYALLHRNTLALVDQVERLKMRLVICYEDQTIPFLVADGRISSNDSVRHAVSDLNWLASHWYSSPSYVHLNRLPVLLSFGDSGLTHPQWKQCLDQLDRPVAYFSEHTRREGAIGAFDWPVPDLGVDRIEKFDSDSTTWPEMIPVAFPRFVDVYGEAGVSKGYPAIADNEGKTFRRTLHHAIQSRGKIIQIATWNDWGEGTNIEPSVEFSYRDLEVVQEERRSSFDPEFRPVADDLRLPLVLYQLRRNAKIDAKKADEIAQMISSGKIKKGAAMIQKFSRE